MTNLVALQHILPSTIWLRNEVLRQNLFSNLKFAGKTYSTIASCASEMESISSIDKLSFQAENGDAKLVFLDDGGGLYQRYSSAGNLDAVGVEQTSFGLTSDWICPVVAVCRSAAKLTFESQIIARGIRRKLQALGVLAGRPKVGIIGIGALGSALSSELARLGLDVQTHDLADFDSDLNLARSALMNHLGWGDLFLGCAGADVLSGSDLSILAGRKIFASCSSREIEFRSLLAILPKSSLFGHIQGMLGGLECHVLNGGYPINFDREREWEEFDEIVLTRRLCLAALSQATSLFGSPAGSVMLDPSVQHLIVEKWLDRVPDRGLLRMPEYLSPKFFIDNSEGHYQMSQQPEYTLHWTTPEAVQLMRGHKAEYEVTVAGLPIVVLPNVWSPAYDWSSLFYVENLVEVAGRSFLEIGSGTGVISVFAGRNGASLIVAVDVNEDAVRNTKRNFERFSISNAEAFVSDGFAAIKGKFDVVTWNAPYHGARPTDELERGCTDEDYRDIKAFFREVQDHLNPRGLVVFGFSESGDLPLIRRLISDAGLRIKRELSDWRAGYNCMLFDLVVDRTSKMRPLMPAQQRRAE